MNLITGSPVALMVGRRMLMVGYVSMGEWQTFSGMVKLDESKAVNELFYFSLHRADPFITRRKVRRLMRKYKSHMTHLMNLICELSIPTKTGKEVMMSDKEADRNIKTAFRQLSMTFGWTAQKISDMSPVQIYQYQMGGKDGTGIQKMSNAEYKSFRARRNE